MNEIQLRKEIRKKLINHNINFFENAAANNELESDETINLKLKRFIENIERIEEEKKELSRQITDIYKEAKTFGFNVKAIREIIRKRKMDADKRIELEQLEETYKEALGMLG